MSPKRIGEIIIDPRFCGPSDSGNGGYACGLAAQSIRGPAEVKLLKPVPLDTPIQLIPSEDQKIEMRAGEEVIAELRAVSLDLSVPSPPSFAEAQQASKNYLGFSDHKYPTCFVCGPERKPGDGLRLFPGKIPKKNVVAASWVPDTSLGDEAGWVRPEFLWAALDCPGAFAAMSDHFPLLLLGTLTAAIEDKIRVGERAVVVGWPLGLAGRKIFVGSAIFSEKGKLIAKAKGVWILVKSP
jgi:hypothetical protein